MNVWKSILKVLSSITKKDIIYSLIILLLIACLSSSVKQCSNTRLEYKNNIAAFNDTIRYYKDKNGNLVATKLVFESDIKTLKLLNEDLYNQIKDLKTKYDVTAGTCFSGVIENPQQDTVWVIQQDTITNGFTRDFAFNNDYRTLEGNVSYKNDTLGVNISKDQVLFDYIVVLDDKNNIMIKSSNPYVRYNQITGFQLPHEKTKRWSLDAFANFNYSSIDNDRFYDIGISLGYSLSKFTIGPQIYFEQNLVTKNKTFYIGGSLNLNILQW